MWEHEHIFSLVVQLVCCWVGGECNNQPSTRGAKVMDKTRLAKVSDRGWRPAAGGKSVDDCTMTKAANDRLGCK